MTIIIVVVPVSIAWGVPAAVMTVITVIPVVMIPIIVMPVVWFPWSPVSRVIIPVPC